MHSMNLTEKFKRLDASPGAENTIKKVVGGPFWRSYSIVYVLLPKYPLLVSYPLNFTVLIGKQELEHLSFCVLYRA